MSVFAAGGGGGGSSPPPPPAAEPPPPAPAPALPAPAPAPSPPAAVCTESSWACMNWGSCEIDGRERRICSTAVEACFGGVNMPELSRVCAGLRCGQLDSLQERIKCRLQLTDAELAAEFQILYFPEYCKAEETSEEQQKCIALYRKFNKCWVLPLGEERTKCGAKVSGFKHSVEKERASCKKKKGPARAKCIEKLNDKIEHFTLFQMYEYSVQAEAHFKQGKASLDAVTDFDFFVETTKWQVERTENKRAWAKLLKEVQARFNEFLGMTNLQS